MVFKTHYLSYAVTGITEIEEGNGLPLEKRLEMLRKKQLLLEK